MYVLFHILSLLLQVKKQISHCNSPSKIFFNRRNNITYFIFKFYQKYFENKNLLLAIPKACIERQKRVEKSLDI